jgi:hypothetical protein
VLVERQAAEHNGIDNREDGGPRSDRQRQDCERDDGECRGVPERTEGVFEVFAHAWLDADDRDRVGGRETL